MKLNELTATEALERLAMGEFSVSEYVDAHVQRVAERQSAVHAFEFFNEKLVREQVVSVSARASRGPLGGIPVAFKDIIDTSDMPTRYGSPIYDQFQPQLDACVVALTRAAGGIVFGKAVSTEFASLVPSNKTRNPADLNRTPGASSSGSAAAVADFQVPLALGTQTAASVVRPAAYCGVYGYKPTWGDISYGGVKFSSPTLDTIGILARSVDDIALFRSVLAEIPFSGIWSRLLAQPRIGVCRTAFWWACETDVKNVFETAIQQLEDAGAELSTLDLSSRFNEVPMAARWIANREGAMGLAPERMNQYEMISKGLRADRIDDGMAVTYERYRAAIELMERCRLELDDVFRDIDVILTPVTTNDAPIGLNYTGNPVFGTLWTGLHVPCLSIPGWRSTSGMPIGLQLVGRRGNDLKLLQTAKWIEERLAFTKP